MKRILIIVLLIGINVVAFAQDLTKFHLYSPTENATTAIGAAVTEAKKSGKHVFVQIGGNWCIWCARFHEFINSDKQIDSLLKHDYVVYHMNYSKENLNLDLLANYGYPQRFGFPVFLVLDDTGKLIHTQNSAYLEEGKGYNKEKVFGFLNDWSPKAFEPQQYKEQ